ncbi:mucin-2-like [Ptychodera flava]|uniref:mucin-2-like n=1 Tax=Ptychodera flava TaxID=63121 RepID=UPI00396AA219
MTLLCLTSIHLTSSFPTISGTSDATLPSTNVEECSEWTEWMDDENGGTLEPSSIGEFELINQLRGPYVFCDEPTDIDCALVDDTNIPYNEACQVSLTCDLQQGFLCFHSQQNGDCFNYAIRVLCPAPCQSQTTPTSTPVRYPSLTTPTSTHIRCPLPARPTSTPVRYPSLTTPTSTSVAGPAPGNAMTLLSLTSMQLTSSISTISGTSAVTRVTQPSANVEVCSEWTEWMDDENGGTLDPYSIGEFELINDLRGPYGFCDEPTDIECALADDTNTPYNESGQVSLTCNLQQGFMCFHSQQSGDCFNYAIRVLCPALSALCQSQTTPPQTSVRYPSPATSTSTPVRYPSPTTPTSIPARYPSPTTPTSTPARYPSPTTPTSTSVRYLSPTTPASMPVRYPSPTTPASTPVRYPSPTTSIPVRYPSPTTPTSTPVRYPSPTTPTTTHVRYPSPTTPTSTPVRYPSPTTSIPARYPSPTTPISTPVLGPGKAMMSSRVKSIDALLISHR